MRNSIAVIPARGGSKRLPGKNKKLFHGKPIIQYSIEAALKSDLFEFVVVTTDSLEIAELAKKMGAHVPFMRPANLSDDFTPIPDVFAHAIEFMEVEQKKKYRNACMVLATAPFIQVDHLQKSYELMLNCDRTAVVPVATFNYPIFRALKMADDNHLSMFWPEHEMTRSNDLQEAYHDVGQFYWVDVRKFLESRRLLLPDSLGFPIPRYLVQDIDTVEDWQRAELIYKAIIN